jgi:RNA polymerase sigma-70 factor (ECF subfamily)
VEEDSPEASPQAAPEESPGGALPPADFEEQALSHMDALYRTALRMTRNPQDAEDLVQETYLKAFRFADTYRHDTNLRAWLFKILTTSAINRYARESHALPADSLDATDEHALYEGLKALGGRFEQGAEDEVLRGMVDEEVRRAVDALPVQFRIAVLLADVEGFSYREIADITNVRLGTVMSRISRGRKLLQKALWEYACRRGLIPAPDGPAAEERARTHPTSTTRPAFRPS